MSEIDFRGRYGSAGSKEVYFARIRKGLDFEKASFGGDRSAAGRYAAQQRWKGHKKDATAPKQARDLTEELKDYFGRNTEEYKKSQGYKAVQQKLIDKQSIATGVGDLQLEVIADMQGFSGLPKVVTSDEINELEQQGWAIAYRGIADNYEDDILATPAKKLAKQFRTGDYFGGLGTTGNGTYFSSDERTAKKYAGDNGEVIRVAIPPNVLMGSEFKEELATHRDKIMNEKMGGFYGGDDIGRKLAARGVRGVEANKFVFGADEKIYIIWDRSMLAVEESKTSK